MKFFLTICLFITLLISFDVVFTKDTKNKFGTSINKNSNKYRNVNKDSTGSHNIENLGKSIIPYKLINF